MRAWSEWRRLCGGLCIWLAGVGADWHAAHADEPVFAPLDYEIELQSVLEHDDGKFLWYHARAAALPDQGAGHAILTLQKHLTADDYYSGLHAMFTADDGATWTAPELPAELDWQEEGAGVTVGVCDVTPLWHSATRRLLAIGVKVRYDAAGRQLLDLRNSNAAMYATYDPAAGTWAAWQMLELPEEDPSYFLSAPGCAQFLIEDDGTVLLPVYHRAADETPYHVTVFRCTFDGQSLRVAEAGNRLSLDVERGFVEPSLARFRGRYYLTLRNDQRAYMATSSDGLHFDKPRPWTFDDGDELGSYNTQAHWLIHSEGLFLAYTRRGLNNDHIIRHRAPLLLGQVDPAKLQVVRETERIIIPERGGEYGNFGASAISPQESWLTAGEGVWSDDARRRGALGTVYVARIRWARPNLLVEP